MSQLSRHLLVKLIFVVLNQVIKLLFISFDLLTQLLDILRCLSVCLPRNLQILRLNLLNGAKFVELVAFDGVSDLALEIVVQVVDVS